MESNRPANWNLLWGKVMKKVRIKKTVIVIAMAVILLVAYLFYSRPMILSQLYPMITLDKCTEISGYYEVGAQAEPSEFYIEQNSGNFKQLCTLFFEQNIAAVLGIFSPEAHEFTEQSQMTFNGMYVSTLKI